MTTKEMATDKIRVFPSSKPTLRIIAAQMNKSYAELVDEKIVQPYLRRTQVLLRKSK